MVTERTGYLVVTKQGEPTRCPACSTIIINHSVSRHPYISLSDALMHVRNLRDEGVVDDAIFLYRVNNHNSLEPISKDD